MPKIEVKKVAEILKKNQLEPALLRQVVEEMNLITAAEADEERAPTIKKQYAILISDPNGTLPSCDYVGWVLQIPEDESILTTKERIHRGTYDYNASRRGRLRPCKLVGEAIADIPAKFFAEAGVWVKTKEPVLVLKTDNEIPMDKPATA